MKSDSKVVLDPDLIDLTMIPPPMTPDEVNLVIIVIYVMLTVNFSGWRLPPIPLFWRLSAHPFR